MNFVLAFFLITLIVLIAGVVIDRVISLRDEQETDSGTAPPVSQEVAIILAELDAELDGEASGKKERIARMLKVIFAPHCHKIEIVGSIRRGVPDPGDIDILFIPKHNYSLIGAIERVCDDETAIRKEDLWRDCFTVKGVQVHLIRVDRQHWGIAMLNFTGSRSFNARWVERAKRRGMQVQEVGPLKRIIHEVRSKGSYSWHTSNEVLDLPEAEILKLMDLEDYLDPTTRN